MYFVTAMTNIITIFDNPNSEDVKNNRTNCFGYFKEKESAIAAVKKNALDVWETTFDFVVIEKVYEGIHPVVELIGWYKYNRKKGQYEEITVKDTGFYSYAIQ